MVLPQVSGLNEITGTVKKNCSIVGEGHKWLRMARERKKQDHEEVIMELNV